MLRLDCVFEASLYVVYREDIDLPIGTLCIVPPVKRKFEPFSGQFATEEELKWIEEKTQEIINKHYDLEFLNKDK